MEATLRDQIAGCRARAKHHREQAQQIRRFLAIEKARPIGRRNPIERLRMQMAITERVRLAQQEDAFAKTLRARAGYPCAK